MIRTHIAAFASRVVLFYLVIFEPAGFYLVDGCRSAWRVPCGCRARDLIRRSNIL